MRAAILLVIAACNLAKPTLAADASADDADTCTSFSSQLDTCRLPPATSAIAITANATYDTVSGMLVIGDTAVPVQHQQIVGPNGAVDILLCKSFVMKKTATLRITGSIVGIVSEGMISVDGTIDVSAGGAGAQATCALGAVAGDDNEPGGGGGGAGFGSLGGDGSDGAGGSKGGAHGGVESLPSLVAGGCPGGSGGRADGVLSGGSGGGAIFVASKMPLTLSGRILAGGGGGKAPLMPNSGGGGGGSGGMILIESPATTVNTGAVIVANGGGGAEGSDSVPGGADGEDGHADASPALGGGATTLGGNGGNGATVLQAATSAAGAMSPTAGGGGGGGGVGYVAIPNASIAVGAIVSPAAGSTP